jgi:hypothetical protein
MGMMKLLQCAAASLVTSVSALLLSVRLRLERLALRVRKRLHR